MKLELNASVDIVDADDALEVLTTKDQAVSFATIWPTAAKAFLDANTANRRVSRPRVKDFVKVIEDGEWKTTPDAITFDWNGVVTNGQHRLLACVEANQPITALVMSGVNPQLRDVIDSGLKRTLGQVLDMQGEPNASFLAAATSQHYRYINRQIVPSPTKGYNTNYSRALGHSTLLAHLEEHPGLRTAVAEVGPARKVSSIINPTAAATLSYITRQIDPFLSAEFMDRVITGINVQRDTPEQVLRDRLDLARNGNSAGTGAISHDTATSTRRVHLGADYQLGIGIKAWNAKRTNFPIKLLRLQATEAFPEAK